MIVETRKTASGTEYWDNEGKKVLFVPAGSKPDFEVTENPKSMLVTEPEPVVDTKTDIDLDVMTVKQLREFAAQNDIEIPEDIKKKDDIIEFLSDAK